mmetsp:Transcript_24995/g.48827  ORF Transcript_24995/g.48827 Transcript_24995/m.48827 type:complete len:414 (+) Transcript_24995:75-1316(+)
MNDNSQKNRRASSTQEMPWFLTKKEDECSQCEWLLLQEVKGSYNTRLVPCGRDKKGNDLFMNTLTMEPKSQPGKADQELIHVVLTHGWGGGMGMYVRNLDALSKVPNIRVHAIDWIGMGRSSRCKFSKWPVSKMDEERVVKQSLNFFLKPLEKWRKRMRIEKMILVGHSLGGYLCANYAIRHPDHVLRLLLVSPEGLGVRPEEKKSSWQLRAAKFLRKLDPRNLIIDRGLGRVKANYFADKKWSNLGIASRTLESLSHYIDSISALPHSGEHAANLFLNDDNYARVPLIERMRDVKVPTAFVMGDRQSRDLRIVRELMRDDRLKCWIESCYEFPNCGVMAFFESPKLFDLVLKSEIERTGTKDFSEQKGMNARSHIRKMSCPGRLIGSDSDTFMMSIAEDACDISHTEHDARV